MGKKLYVGNLSFGTTEMELRELFGQFGTVVETKVVMDRETGRPRGFAFVEMTADAEAAKAIEELSGRELDGRTINVSEARERERTGGARSGSAPAGGGGWGGRAGGGRGRW
jgi:RNA recognition motif-containing protein